MLVKRKSRPKSAAFEAPPEPQPVRCSCGRCRRCRRRVSTERWRRAAERRRRSLDAITAYLMDLSWGQKAAEGWSAARTRGLQ